MSVATLRTRVAAVRSDPLMTNSVLMLATTMLMAGGGALFWILAARLQSPANVGLAGSLVARPRRSHSSPSSGSTSRWCGPCRGAGIRPPTC
jgi:hypothetical protein